MQKRQHRVKEKKAMKIGISYDPFDNGRFARFGEQRFAVIKACGFDALDYSLAHTETALYTGSETEAEAFIRAEREAMTQAGLFAGTRSVALPADRFHRRRPCRASGKDAALYADDGAARL